MHEQNLIEEIAYNERLAQAAEIGRPRTPGQSSSILSRGSTPLSTIEEEDEDMEEGEDEGEDHEDDNQSILTIESEGSYREESESISVFPLRQLLTGHVQTSWISSGTTSSKASITMEPMPSRPS